MPIPSSEIVTDWVVLDKASTVRQVRGAIPPDERRKRWIVTPLAQGVYAVYRLGDLIAFLQSKAHGEMVEPWMLNQSLGELDGFLDAFARPAVDRTADWDAVRASWNPLSDPPLAVLDDGKLVGVLKSALRGGGGDADWLDNEPKSANGGGQHAEPPSHEAPPPAPGVLESTPDAPAPPARKITARFDPEDQKDKPLQVGTTYTLVFTVELEQLTGVIAEAALDERRLFPPNVDQVELYVQLLSEDFDIFTDPQKLVVPREGKSRNKARFDFAPKHNGASTLTAVFVKDGNAVQAMELKLNVGVGNQAIIEAKPLGRPVEAAGAVKPRGLSIWIDYIGAGFKFSFLDSGGSSSFVVPIQLQELEQAINDARAVLEQIVELKDKNNPIYQTAIDIPPAVNQKTLPQLAEAGYLLFQTIFMHPGGGQPAKDFAKRLRDMTKQETLNIQIISEQMLLPWGMLYVTDRFDPNNIQPECFLGLKHIIEHAPMQPDMNFPTNIASQPKLTVSLNLNLEIDKQMNFPLIQNQVKYWDGIKSKGGVDLIMRTTGDALLDAMGSDQTPDQIAYFYCHAVSTGLNEGGPRASTLQFGANQSVTLRDFMLRAPNDIRLPNSPLVFINACESAELSPLFYSGFMPYFVDKGARGMIGTECPIPGLFAMDWAAKFFDQFLAGKPLGQIFLDLRRDYYFNHQNILGLLYAVYCDADTQITPPLA